MTSEYTFVAPERQNELTRRIQQRLVDAAKKQEEKRATEEAKPEPPIPPVPPPPSAPPNADLAIPFTTMIQ
jgi:hypothetical protein